MSIREVEEIHLGAAIYLHVVEVTEPGVGLSTVYEIRCAVCGNVDTYEQRSAAIEYGPTHLCETTP